MTTPQVNTPQPAARSSYVRSLARGLSVLGSFTPDSPVQTVSQVAAMTRIDRAGVRRMLRTLEALGYVHREGPKFHLAPRVLDLAYMYLSTTPLCNIAEPVLEKLVSVVHESCSVSVLDGSETVFVVRVPVHKIMSINLAIGSRLPAYCTSAGRILLGDLSKERLDRALKASGITKHTRYTVTSIPELKRIVRRDRARGWSLLNQELEEGVCALSVPIVDRTGRIIAAINVAGSFSRATPRKMISTVLPRLKHAAQEINSLLLG
jgi:IclR family pca regulon transcriptional regulator